MNLDHEKCGYKHDMASIGAEVELNFPTSYTMYMHDDVLYVCMCVSLAGQTLHKREEESGIIPTVLCRSVV
jgi:hypothetical protein